MLLLLSRTALRDPYALLQLYAALAVHSLDEMDVAVTGSYLSIFSQEVIKDLAEFDVSTVIGAVIGAATDGDAAERAADATGDPAGAVAAAAAVVAAAAPAVLRSVVCKVGRDGFNADIRLLTQLVERCRTEARFKTAGMPLHCFGPVLCFARHVPPRGHCVCIGDSSLAMQPCASDRALSPRCPSCRRAHIGGNTALYGMPRRPSISPLSSPPFLSPISPISTRLQL